MKALPQQNVNDSNIIKIGRTMLSAPGEILYDEDYVIVSGEKDKPQFMIVGCLDGKQTAPPANYLQAETLHALILIGHPKVTTSPPLWIEECRYVETLSLVDMPINATMKIVSMLSNLSSINISHEDVKDLAEIKPYINKLSKLKKVTINNGEYIVEN